MTPVPEAIEAPTTGDFLECITQSPTEPAPAEFLEVCTVEAELLSRSGNCPASCGGHPICRPCYDLAVQQGLAV